MTERAQETWTGQGGSDTSRPTARRGIAHQAASQQTPRFGNRSARRTAARVLARQPQQRRVRRGPGQRRGLRAAPRGQQARPRRQMEEADLPSDTGATPLDPERGWPEAPLRDTRPGRSAGAAGGGAGEDHAAATACYPALGDRLGTFTLARAAEKTRSIALPRPQTQPRVACRGVACRWGTERSGKAQVKRRTSRTKLQQSLAHVTEWCRKSRHLRLRRRFERLNATLQGSYHDSGVKGHGSRLEGFDNRARPILLTWRNRRSQRRSRNGPGVTV